jgi:hypothetical protein
MRPHFLLYTKKAQKPFYFQAKKDLASQGYKSSLISDYYTDLDIFIDLDSPSSHNAWLDSSTIYDVYFRCRVLRNMPYSQALRIIYSAAESLHALLKNFETCVFVSTRCDTFIHHLAVILSQKYSSSFSCLMFWKSPFFSDSIFFTSLGESNSPGDCATLTQGDHASFYSAQLKNILSQDNFKATSISSTQLQILSLRRLCYFFEYHARRLAISLDSLSKRKSYLTLHNKYATIEVVPTSLLELFRELVHGSIKYKEPNLKEKFAIIFLQVNPEATIDYYVDDTQMIVIDFALSLVIKCIELAGYKVYIKDHPNMCVRRNSAFYSNILRKHPSVSFVDPAYPSQKLIKCSSLVFTWSGTAILQSFALRRPVIYCHSPFVNNSQLGLKFSRNTAHTDIQNFVNQYNKMSDSLYNDHLSGALSFASSLHVRVPDLSLIPGKLNCSSLGTLIAHLALSNIRTGYP